MKLKMWKFEVKVCGIYYPVKFQGINKADAIKRFFEMAERLFNSEVTVV